MLLCLIAMKTFFLNNYMQNRSWTAQRPCTLNSRQRNIPFWNAIFSFLLIILPLNHSSFSIYSTSLDSCSEPSLSSSQTNDFLFCQSELMKEHKHDVNLLPVILYGMFLLQTPSWDQYESIYLYLWQSIHNKLFYLFFFFFGGGGLYAYHVLPCIRP